MIEGLETIVSRPDDILARRGFILLGKDRAYDQDYPEKNAYEQSSRKRRRTHRVLSSSMKSTPLHQSEMIVRVRSSEEL